MKLEHTCRSSFPIPTLKKCRNITSQPRWSRGYHTRQWIRSSRDQTRPGRWFVIKYSFSNPFRCFTYVTAHSPTLPFFTYVTTYSLNPSFASPTSQDFHLRHLASHPCYVPGLKFKKLCFLPIIKIA